MAGMPYFYLSYAHSGPSSEAEAANGVSHGGSHGVSDFFHALCKEVAWQAKLSSSSEVGFYDRLIKPGDDWNAAVAQALGTAKVFVPLYSPSYFNKSWTMRERESFRRRLTELGVQDVSRYIVPVLWTPFAPWDVDDEIADALRLAEDIGEYKANGLRALGMLTLFRSQYEQIVKRVAARIVESVTLYALEPSQAPPVPELAPKDAEFIVAVIAPDLANLPPGRDGHGYATTAAGWRPFGDNQALSIASYAEGTAERLGSAPMAGQFQAVRPMLGRRPGLVLIDPWFILTRDGPAVLAEAMRGLPLWVTPLLVFDGRAVPLAGEDSAAVIGEVSELLEAVGHSGVQVVTQLEDFVDLLPELITQARRRFLKHGPHDEQAGPVVERYTLRGNYVPPSTNGNMDR